MFGTFNLFNFLQQPNTGKTPRPGTFDPSYITQGLGHSGTVSEANWPFPYAGTLVPYEIVKGGGAAFSIKLSSDLNFDVPLETGLHYAVLQENISGKFDGDVERGSTSLGMSGGFFPKDTDFSSSYLLFSGLVTGSPPDISTNHFTISGVVLDTRPDFTFPTLIFSGQIKDAIPDFQPVLVNLSGVISSGNVEPDTVKVTLSGKLLPVNSDTSNISYGMLSFSALFNKIISGTEFTNQAVLNYGFTSYFSTRGI